MNEIELKNVCKTFILSRKQMKLNHAKNTKIVAVNDLSFVCNKGEIYGLLGSNGAGKTTTLRMIATLIKPDSGVISVMGHDVAKEPYEVRRSISFLTSELKLDEFFTPDYLYMFYSSLYDIEPSQAIERKKALFGRFGIDRFSAVKVSDLSTGMKQKVSLAISLCHDSEVVVFDEPTNGLDVLTAKTVTDYLLSLREEGKTIIVSTHIFSLIEKIADRVGIIIDGHMALEGGIKELTAEKSLEDVFFDLYKSVKGDEQ